jgi:hypothetical protein
LETMKLQQLQRGGVPLAACNGHSRSGNPCKNPAIPGGTVCPWHGGRAPQVREAAQKRLLSLVPDAIEAMAMLAGIVDGTFKLDPHVQQRALADILDRAGLRPADQVVLSEASAPAPDLDEALTKALRERGLMPDPPQLPDGIEDADVIGD